MTGGHERKFWPRGGSTPSDVTAKGFEKRESVEDVGRNGKNMQIYVTCHSTVAAL